jgi:anthranilate phosphoribosyltransferase
MKHAIGPRKEMAVRTVFNMLGPLTNPAGAKRQLLGVYDRALVRPVAEVLRALGSVHVMVVHSADGLDEISIAAETAVAELKSGDIAEYVISPEDFSLVRGSLNSLKVDSATESLTMVKAALSGEFETAGDMVALNAGAAVYVSGQAIDLVSGVRMAQDAIGSGLATEKMKEFVDFTVQLGDSV